MIGQFTVFKIPVTWCLRTAITKQMLQEAFTLLQTGVIFEQHCKFVMWGYNLRFMAEDATNDTFKQSQVLCKFQHLSRHCVMLKKGVMSPYWGSSSLSSLAALFTDHTWITRKGVSLCVRKLSHPHSSLFIFKVRRPQSSLTIWHSFLKAVLFSGRGRKYISHVHVALSFAEVQEKQFNCSGFFNYIWGSSFQSQFTGIFLQKNARNIHLS